jgi:predicted GIY-YIG superfamily endonuclease
MVLYRFYRITSTVGDECYIGSTTKTLSARFSRHKAGHKLGNGTASAIIFNKYGVETCSIELISEQEFDMKVDALREERRLIEDCLTVVNKIRPIREKEEHRQELIEYDRKRREEHRETLNAKQREKIACDVCEKSISRTNMTRHKKSCQVSKK